MEREEERSREGGRKREGERGSIMRLMTEGWVPCILWVSSSCVSVVSV